MSPGEAIAVGGGSGLGVVGLFTLFGRHLFSRWLKNIDDLPEKLEESKRDLHRSFDEFKREINETLESNGRDMVRDIGVIKGDNERAIDDTNKEMVKLRDSAHRHREQTGVDLGRVSNRVDNLERTQNEMKQDVRSLESRLHRVDLNVVAVAVKLGIEPVMPTRSNEDRGDRG